MWQVDLGDYCTVSWIRIFNRADEADGQVGRTAVSEGPSWCRLADLRVLLRVCGRVQDPLKYMKRLFPCWIICSREPFDESLYGEESLEQVGGSHQHPSTGGPSPSCPSDVTGWLCRRWAWRW